MSDIILKNIDKYFDGNHVLKDIHLHIEEGEFMTLLGPSGCGKTTILRIIAGLEDPEHGVVYMGDTCVVEAKDKLFLSPAKRDLNLVFQSYALWPHMTVFENVSFGLDVQKLPKKQIRQKVEDALERMQIKHLLDRSPSELSGGQQQRVAIARAIVTEPKILLLDEPLSNLDAKLRIEMRAELKRLHHELQTTIVYVTHDQIEALTLSTRIAVFFAGELIQVDTPKKLYEQPKDMRVAEFIGNPSINLLLGDIEEAAGRSKLHTSLGTLAFTRNVPSPKQVMMALKPEDILIQQQPSQHGVQGVIYSVLPAGAETFIQVKVDDQLLMAKVSGDVHFMINTLVWVTCFLKKVNVYDIETNELIPIEQVTYTESNVSLIGNG